MRYLEQLERRFLRDGRVTLMVDDGVLLIRGDDGANAIEIDRGGDAQSIVLRGVSGTLINGSATLTMPLPRAGVRLEMGAGDDSVLIRRVFLRGSVVASLGEGDDRLTVNGVRITGDLRVAGERGNDRIAAVGGTLVQREAFFTGGGGIDRFLIDRSTVGSSTIIDNSAKSFVTFFRAEARGKSVVHTANGVDHIKLWGTNFAGDIDLDTRGAADRILIRANQFAAGVDPIGGGTEDDRVDRDLYLSYDFARGTEGWESGFSDYNGLNDGDPVEFLNIRSEIVPLPDELGIDADGWLLSGNNQSDDLYQYLIRKLGPDEGVLPGVAYLVEFEIRFASNQPGFLVGGGGPPGEAVWVTVVATGNEPQIRPFEGRIGNLRLDVPPEARSTAGNIVNGGPQGTFDIYRVVDRRHIHPTVTTASADGELWVLAGADSGFQGITTLYYLSIAVRLTPVNSE